MGDEIEVHLSLTSKHRLQYVHLRDPRGVGFEPVSTTSRYKWDLGIGWYEEIRDSATNFFFEWLPHGEYTFKYRLRATTQGTFKAGPAVVHPCTLRVRRVFVGVNPDHRGRETLRRCRGQRLVIAWATARPVATAPSTVEVAR